MKNLSLWIIEILVCILFLWHGRSNTHFLWVNNARSAAITLSAIGFVLCMVSIGTFISTAPAHPLTLGGYVLGTILLLSMIAQIFKLNFPIVGKSETALNIIGVCIILKGLIAQFQNVLKN